MLRVLTSLSAEHDWRLLALASVVCILASFVAVGVFHRACVAKGTDRTVWIGVAGTATGCGVWAAHVVALLGWQSDIVVGYDAILLVLSLALAAVTSTAGLACALRPSAVWAVPSGGAVVGTGIAAMDMTAAWSLDLPGTIAWSLDLVAISVALGIIFAATAVLAAMRDDRLPQTVVATVLFALAIALQYIAGIAAVTFVRDPARAVALTPPDALFASPHVVAVAIGGVATAILAMCLVAVMADRRLRAACRQQDHQLDVALNNMSQGLCMFDGLQRLVVCNRRYLQMYGLSADVVKPGCTLREMLAHRAATGSFSGNADTYIADLLDSVAQGRTVSRAVELGDGRVVEVMNSPMPGGGWVATHDDITERRRAEKALEQTRIFLDTVIESVPAAILVKDARDFRYMLINKAGEDYFGMPRADMIGKTVHDVFSAATAETIMAHDHKLLEAGTPLFFDEHPIETPGCGVRIVATTRRPVLGDDGKPRYLLSVVQDVTDRKRAEARIAHMAHHDALTDLPNRAAFNECFDHTLSQAAKSKESLAVLCVDVDRFKEVNDVFGHAVGDALLRTLSERLGAAAEGAFLARLGGDEFALLQADGPQPASAVQLADRVVAIGADEFDVQGHRLKIGVSVGIAVYPNDGTDAAALLANANAALYRTKAAGRGSYRFFEPDMDQRLRERRALVHDLGAALGRGEIVVYYQPLARLDCEITGFEALVRWQHPTRGMISPGEFIPAAEESGFILELGEWILRESCREAASWLRPLRVAVNLSPVQFRHGDLPGLIHAVLLETGLAPNRLELEITEGVLIDDLPRALSTLRRLKLLGVRIAMDDFGTGYSSLSNLQAFPFDKIKVDRSFISNLESNPQSATIVRAVIALGRGLALPVVAEGVETKEQLAFLAAESCAEVQGYLIGKPLPIGAYAKTVGRRAAAARSA